MRIALSILLIFTFHLTFGQNADIRKEISKIIRYDTEIDHNEIPGFSIAIIDGDSIFYFHYGSSSKDTEQQLAPDLIYEIGSISKVFTSFLAGRLIDEGYFSADSKVNELIPGSYSNPRLENLSVWHLLNHRSGFPKLPAYFGKYQRNINDPYANYKQEDLLIYFKDYVPEKEVEGFNYSHINYALLELVAENTTGRSFHDLLEEYIFRPLNLDDSFLDFPEDKEITNGYDRALRKSHPWTFNCFGASEGMKSSLRDLSHFTQIHCNLNEGSDLIFLKELLEIQSDTDYNDQIYMANGWHVLKKNDYNIYTHTGKTSGHSGFVGFVKETGTGVVILANSSTGTQDLGFLILRMINYNWKRKADVR